MALSRAPFSRFTLKKTLFLLYGIEQTSVFLIACLIVAPWCSIGLRSGEHTYENLFSYFFTFFNYCNLNMRWCMIVFDITYLILHRGNKK